MSPELRSSPNPSRSDTDISHSPAVEDEDSVNHGADRNHENPVETPLAGESELRLLQRWFRENPSEAKAWRVLNALVAESLKKVGQSDTLRRFDDEDLCAASGLDEFSWTQVAKWWRSREHEVEAAMRTARANVLPFPDRRSRPRGGRGNRAMNAWLSRPLASRSTSVTDEELEERRQEVVYRLETKQPIQLTGLLRRYIFKHQALLAASWRYRLLRWRVLASCVLVIILGGAGLELMLFERRPVESRDIAILIVVGLFLYLWWDDWRPLSRSFNDRMCALPKDWLKSGSPPAQLERRRTAAGETLNLVRYVASCPICGSELYLDGGEPERPRRMVGRCLDAPREHVFSFDPVLHRGERLLF